MTKKELLSQTLESHQNELMLMEVNERFLQRKALKEPNKFDAALASIQQKMKDSKELIDFLEEMLKEQESLTP